MLFATAIEAINTLSAAQKQCRLKAELNKYPRPNFIVDRRDRLPSHRQNRRRPALPDHQPPLRTRLHGLTTNNPTNNGPRIFNNDATITSAVLDRLLHHNETILIEGRSYRTKDQGPEA